MEIGDKVVSLLPVETHHLMGDISERIVEGTIRAKSNKSGILSYRVTSDPDPCSVGFDISQPHWSSWRGPNELGEQAVASEINRERIEHAIHEIMQNGQHDGDSMEEKVVVLDKVLKILAGEDGYNSLSFYNGSEELQFNSP